jgi:O-antigen/teichoic acid export membrane protein
MASNDRKWLSSKIKPQWREAKGLMKEGLGLQIAVLLSMLRDNIHLFIVGPWFGKEWAGFYAWGLQLCTVASQVFVQTATRVGLPALRLTVTADSRWRATLKQITLLTIFTGPSLIFLLDIARALNVDLFQEKWSGALTLLPFLVLRMFPSLFTTPLGTLVLTERNSNSYMLANAWWTGSELLIAIAMLWLYGPIGLAWSYAFMAWIGVVIFIRQLSLPARFITLIPLLIFRPSLWVSVILALVYKAAVLHEYLSKDLITIFLYSGIGMLICIAIERKFWKMLIRRADEIQPRR